MKPIRIISEPGDVFRISYMVSNFCNYKCDYCFPGSNEGTHSYNKDWELLVKNMKHMFDYYTLNTSKKRFDINITGGEPTMWPDLGKFCSGIKSDNVMISLQTNGSRTLSWWQENGYNFSKVLMSAHHKEIDVDHFIQVADTLYEQEVFVVATVCMDPNHWDKCLDIIEQFKSKSKHRWYMRLQKLEGNYVYTDEQTEFLKKPVVRLPNISHAWKHRKKFYDKESRVQFDNGNITKMSSHEISLNNWNHFLGWECNLGIDSMFINLDGRLSGSCQEKLYGLNDYYNIYDDNFVELFDPDIIPVKCRQLGCYCVPEINLSKKLL